MTTGILETNTQAPSGKAPGMANAKVVVWDGASVHCWYGIMYVRASARWHVFWMFAPYVLTISLGLMFGYEIGWGHGPYRTDSENTGLLAWFTALSAMLAMCHTCSTLILCVQDWWGERKHWKKLVALFKRDFGFDPLSKDPPLELLAKYPRSSKKH